MQIFLSLFTGEQGVTYTDHFNAHTPGCCADSKQI